MRILKAPLEVALRWEGYTARINEARARSKTKPLHLAPDVPRGFAWPLAAAPPGAVGLVVTASRPTRCPDAVHTTHQERLHKALFV